MKKSRSLMKRIKSKPFLKTRKKKTNMKKK